MNDSCSNGSLKLVNVDRRGHLSRFFKDKQQIKSTDRLHWLDILLKLVFRGSYVDAVDINGRTPLHIAAHNGLADAVSVLLQRNASLEKRDKYGKTPLEVAVENALIVPKHPPFLLAPKMEGLEKALLDHEMVVYLLLSYGALFKKCNRSGRSLLHKAIINQQPYIVQLLLLKGASLTCKDNLGRTPLVTYLQNGGEWIDAVLNDFTATITIKCANPFNSSVFHLLSYRSPTVEENNFFDSKKCNECNNPGCDIRKGPLAEAVESHPKKQGIMNSCLDAEGFTPLHRAAQGANLVAIRYLLANGADDYILSPHGHDALTLAILHAGTNLWRLYGVLYSWHLRTLRITEASDAAIELLHHAMNSRGYRITCDSSKPQLTLYHLASSRGLVKFIKVLLEERKSHQLDIDCPNKDGITPMYLAKMFGNLVRDGHYNPWEHVIQVIESYGGEMLYPTREAEYNVIYSRLYGWIPKDFTLDLKPSIHRFLTSLLTLYEKSENSSFICAFENYDFGINMTFSLQSIEEEFTEAFKVQMCRNDYQFLAMAGLLLREMTRCSRKHSDFLQYFSLFQFQVLSTSVFLRVPCWDLYYL